MALSLTRRAAQFGNSISVNTQHHGDKDVSALYLNFSVFPVTKEELPEVCLEEKAYQLLYRKWKGRPDEPIWGKLAPEMKFKDKVKGVSAILYLGRKQLKVNDATLSGIRLEPQTGGISQLSFQLQCVPDMDENHPMMEALLSRVNQKLDIELYCESYGAQPELPFEEEDTGEDDESSDVDEDQKPKGRSKNRKE